MTEESHLEMLQRKVRISQRRRQLCYIARQLLAEDTIIVDPIDRPLTVLVANMPRNGSYEFDSVRDHRYSDPVRNLLVGHFTISHEETPEHHRLAPKQDPHWNDFHIVIHRGAFRPDDEDLFAQEQMLERIMLVLEKEIDEIRADIAKGETYPNVSKDGRPRSPYR